MSRVKSGLSLGEYAILGVLRERPMHGYEIARRFGGETELGIVLPIDMSNVYAMLKDLQEQGLIEGRRETVGLRPPRTVFSLTTEAEAAFLEWIATPVGRMREIRADLLVKLYFCRAIGVNATAHLLEAQIAASQEYVVRLERLRADTAPGSFERLVYDSKLGPARATAAWLEAERAQLAG